MNTYNWYQQLIKPSWAPPSWIFGPVWTVLYLIIAVTFTIVFYKAFNKQIPAIIALPFFLNLIFNFLFSPIQFGLKNNLLASIDIIFVLVTLVWALLLLWKAAPSLHWIVYINIPYVMWVAFATILQLRITYLNA